MNTHSLLRFVLPCVLCVPWAIQAGPRTSASYTITTDTTGSGGSRATSAAYTNDGSAGGVVGISAVASPAEKVKNGFIGQLTEVTALQLAASPTTVNEGTTRQISATVTLDDATTSALLATDVTWSVQSGPLTSISTGGLATAGTVYQNTAAVARGDYFEITGTLNLTVVNTNTDDIPGYSGDGIDDAWQVQYFGQNNSNASPTADPDGDGQDNRFEFLAGLSPTDPTARFLLTPSPVPNQPGQMNLVINPRFSDRTYTVLTSPTLGIGAVWTPLTTFTTSDNGLTRTITDTSATGSKKFYQIQIAKP